MLFCFLYLHIFHLVKRCLFIVAVTIAHHSFKNSFFFLILYFPLLVVYDLVPFPLILFTLFSYSISSDLSFFLLSSLSLTHPPFLSFIYFLLYSFYFSSFLPPSFLRYSLPLSLPLPHHPSQPHVAEEGSPVVEDFINQASASLGGKITISYFERWNLGQTEKPQTTTDQK